MNIIGRKKEMGIISSCLMSNKSEFVAVYGRRRVGKTYLIKELFDNEFTFYATGILNGSRESQLDVWNKEISRYKRDDIVAADNWMEAFENLNTIVESIKSSDNINDVSANKKVIFLDEVPWMATMHSDFLSGLDFFWNRYASSRGDVLLIICGSAASWITNNIINNRGGLHNRLTRQILVEPWSLAECEDFFNSRNIPMTRFQMTEAYMVFGGIPYYLELFEPHLSLYQNIDEIYFRLGAQLTDEFSNLYKSLYNNAEKYIDVIEAIASKGVGLTRNEIVKSANISDGGSLTRILKDLALSGFIRNYKGYGKTKRDSIYQLIDFFSMFDIKFRNRKNEFTKDFWLSFSSTLPYKVWSGYCYEKVCLLHIEKLREKLGISGVLTSAYAWRDTSEEGGAQVDLVIDRNDGLINLCEIKFSSEEYTITKSDYDSFRRKRSIFVNSTKTKKAVQTTLITTFGIKRNTYSSEIVSEVTMDDLFD